MTSFDFVLLGLAAYRWTMLVTHDEISRPIREWAQRWPNGLGFLLTCPFCFGVWAAVVGVVAYVNAPAWLWYTVVVVPAVAAVVSLLSLLLPPE